MNLDGILTKSNKLNNILVKFGWFWIAFSWIAANLDEFWQIETNLNMRMNLNKFGRVDKFGRGPWRIPRHIHRQHASTRSDFSGLSHARLLPAYELAVALKRQVRSSIYLSLYIDCISLSKTGPQYIYIYIYKYIYVQRVSRAMLCLFWNLLNGYRSHISMSMPRNQNSSQRRAHEGTRQPLLPGRD